MKGKFKIVKKYIDEYDYYQYDDQIMQDVTELMERLGYIIIRKG